MRALEELDRKVLNDEIQSHLDKATKLAVDNVEKMAREILAHNPELKEFIMAMGTWFFVDKHGHHIDNADIKEYPALEPLFSFICKWDNELKITGESMRFTAFGPKITDW